MISTIGMSVWRAGCAGTCTSGSEGGPGKPTGRKSGRAPRFDPTRAERPDPHRAESRPAVGRRVCIY